MVGPPALPLNRRIKKAGIRLLARIVPSVYVAYMKLVLATSRVHYEGVRLLVDRKAAGQPSLLILLHQDCVTAPFLFRDQGLCTLANVGDAGDIVTSLLEGVGFVVMRGGSSSRASRRIPVVGDLIRYARGEAVRGYILALVPDGSRGPAGACKPGCALVAMKTGAPLYCAKAHARRAIYLNTWDRTMLPLPFNEIWFDVADPITIAADAGREELEACRLAVETTLRQLHERAFRRCDREPVPTLTPYVRGAFGRASGPARAA